MYLNKAIIIGNLTRDPEMKTLPSGVAVTSFSLATNRTWKDKEGNKQEQVEYHNIVSFGKQAENIAKYMTKGTSMLVEGRLQTRSWESDDGKKNYRTEIVVESVQFGYKKDGQSAPKKKAPAQQQKPIETIEYPEEDINPDDIPF